nr:PepSY domain-containing protein [uncultured Xylophilus sp.]
MFYQEIDTVLHPEIQIVASGPAAGWSSTVWDDALATLRTQWPERNGAWRFEVTGVSGVLPVRYLPTGAGHHAFRGMAWLSSDGRQVLRSDEWGHYLMTWIYDLHMELTLEAFGRSFVGWGGLASLLLLLTGLWAWWPKGKWANALRIKTDASPIRTLRDMHKLAGLAGFGFLAMLALTGAMLALPKESNSVLELTFGKVHRTAVPCRPSPMACPSRWRRHWLRPEPSCLKDGWPGSKRRDIRAARSWSVCSSPAIRASGFRTAMST